MAGSSFRLIAPLCFAALLSTFVSSQTLLGYTPASNVDQHSRIGLDVCAIKDFILSGSNPDYVQASAIYNEGQNSQKSSGAMRTLVGMAQKSSSSSYWRQYVEYYSGAAQWMHVLISSALSGSTGEYSWSEEARKQVIIKGVQDNVLPMYAIHELDAALGKLSEGNIDPDSGAPHAWDEGWAFYAGTEEASQCTPYRTAEDLATEFGTMGNGRSLVNERILAQYTTGLEAVGRNGGLAAATEARNEIVRLMMIPYIQGTLKLAHQLDQDIAQSAEQSVIDGHQAEAWVYFRQIETVIARHDSEGATSLSNRFHVNRAASAGNYADAYCVFNGILSLEGLSWTDIGTLPNAPQGVECPERNIQGFLNTEAVVGQCSSEDMEAWTSECSVSNDVSPLLGDDKNDNDVCAFKYTAVECMYDKADAANCDLPEFAVPIEIKEEVYSDRRHLLGSDRVISAQEAGYNLRLGVTEANNMDCCKWFKDTHEASSGDRRRNLLASSGDLKEYMCVEEDDDSSKNKYFSVPALLIIYRETVEAAIIVAVLIQFMEKTNNPHLKKWVWLGTAAGVIASIGMGIIFIAVYYIARDNLFAGDARYIFEGVVSCIATIMITILAFCMLRMWNMQEIWEKKLAAQMETTNLGDDMDEENIKDAGAIDKENQYTAFSLAFSAVFREGIESVVFLAGIGANTEPSAIPIPGILGVILGVITGLLMYRGGGMMKTIKTLFTVFTVLLLVIAAGIFMYGLHEFQEAAVFGTWKPKEDRPWHNEYLWDLTHCCSHKEEGFWAMLRALVGYTATPTFVEIMGYLCYWIFVGGALYYRYKSGTLTTKDISKPPLKVVFWKWLMSKCGQQASETTGDDKGAKVVNVEEGKGPRQSSPDNSYAERPNGL